MSQELPNIRIPDTKPYFVIHLERDHRIKLEGDLLNPEFHTYRGIQAYHYRLHNEQNAQTNHKHG